MSTAGRRESKSHQRISNIGAKLIFRRRGLRFTALGGAAKLSSAPFFFFPLFLFCGPLFSPPRSTNGRALGWFLRESFPARSSQRFTMHRFFSSPFFILFRAAAGGSQLTAAILPLVRRQLRKKRRKKNSSRAVQRRGGT